jgi:predicted ester cyclase
VEALGSGDDEGARALVADSFDDHSPSWGTDTLDSVLASDGALRGAMPDLRFEIDRDNSVAEGDQVAAHSIVRGTHTGDALFGAEPSGNEIIWTHTDFVRIADGKVVERWSASDTLTLYQQAGVLPAQVEA